MAGFPEGPQAGVSPQPADQEPTASATKGKGAGVNRPIAYSAPNAAAEGDADFILGRDPQWNAQGEKCPSHGAASSGRGADLEPILLSKIG